MRNYCVAKKKRLSCHTIISSIQITKVHTEGTHKWRIYQTYSTMYSKSLLCKCDLLLKANKTERPTTFGEIMLEASCELQNSNAPIVTTTTHKSFAL